ncbi:hypothetical protein ACIF6H_36115 [Streptomyces microflavus]|uniref:hypothetical protein n=1 Tax=Streptomyces TaxID=1883 RepID=UPI00117DDD0E|nr:MULTISPECIES: hypothetical protein [unclassified Streptomyces]
MIASRPENSLLRALLREAMWSGDALASAVNALGAESGLTLRYRRPSVAQWLGGSIPRAEVRVLVAEAFSRRLGREISTADVGMAAPRAARSASECESQQTLPASPLYRLATLGDTPTKAEGRSRSLMLGPALPNRLSKHHVTAVRDMVTLLSRTEQTTGAGTARQAFTSYIDTIVLPWLKLSGRPAIRHELLTESAGLIYLGGFLYFDDDLQGPAQHYYQLSASLADEAGDACGLALALRGLSVQAWSLGHYRQAYRLAEAGASSGCHGGPGMVAFLNGQLALCAAATGDRKAALEHLALADLSLSRADTTKAPLIGAYNRASLAHHRAYLTRHLGDSAGALAALKEASQLRPAHEARPRALILARRAELELELGYLEAACGTWQAFLAARRGIRSRRLDRAVTTMRACLSPYQHNLGARAVLAASRSLP